MDEKEKEETERKATEEAKTKKTVSGTNDPKNRTAAERKAEIEEREALATREEELIAREDAINAKKALGGQSEAGSEPEKPKRLSDTEYSEALEKGEVNPLKEDGLL